MAETHIGFIFMVRGKAVARQRGDLIEAPCNGTVFRDVEIAAQIATPDAGVQGKHLLPR